MIRVGDRVRYARWYLIGNGLIRTSMAQHRGRVVAIDQYDTATIASVDFGTAEPRRVLLKNLERI